MFFIALEPLWIFMMFFSTDVPESFNKSSKKHPKMEAKRVVNFPGLQKAYVQDFFCIKLYKEGWIFGLMGASWGCGAALRCSDIYGVFKGVYKGFS